MRNSDRLELRLSPSDKESLSLKVAQLAWESASESAKKNFADRVLLMASICDSVVEDVVNRAKKITADLLSKKMIEACKTSMAAIDESEIKKIVAEKITDSSKSIVAKFTERIEQVASEQSKWAIDKIVDLVCRDNELLTLVRNTIEKETRSLIAQRVREIPQMSKEAIEAVVNPQRRVMEV